MKSFLKLVLCVFAIQLSGQQTTYPYQSSNSLTSLGFEDEYQWSEEDNDLMNETPMRSIVAPKEIPLGFYLVTGVFGERTAVKRELRRLKKQEITAEYFQNSNTGLYYIYRDFVNSQQEAINALETLKNQNPDTRDVWILQVTHVEVSSNEEIMNSNLAEAEAPKSSLEERPNQSKLIQKADFYFKKMWYAEAAKYYEMALAKGENQYTYEVLKKAADSYYFNTDMEQAFKYYDLLYKRYGKELSSENLFKYAHALKGNGRYNRARRIMNLYYDKAGQEQEKNDISSDYRDVVLDEILEVQKDITLTNLEINTEYSEFSPMFYEENEMVFASATRNEDEGRKYRWNDQPFLDLYVAKLNEESDEFRDALKFSTKINTRYHEASVAFTPDNQTMFFTRNNYRKRLGKDKNGINHLKIYRSVKSDEEWSEAEELPFNSEWYSTGHPALSPDGKLLYFVSDMPGSLGETDIFVVEILEDGNFGTPRNLGPEVNTDKREMFPFITEEKLYFSSDGHIGLGGLDVFEIALDEELGLTEPVNLGHPINSSLDDFSFIIDEDSQKGFLASNREGGKGSDDIYAFSKPLAEETAENAIAGIVTDLITSEVMPEALVILLDENNRKLKEIEVGEDGSFIFEDLESNKKYKILASSSGYEDKQQEIITASNETIQANVQLRKLNDMIVVENGVRKLKTETIYFDFDRDNIREDASTELDKLVAVMQEYSDMVIAIESHTDSRGSSAYNRDLSDRRAKSTREYLISQGIAPERIQSAIGYGEDRLLNECDGSVACSREQHQLNRRSEFIIVKM